MDETVFDNMPQLRTERLGFRLVNSGDADLLFAFNSDPAALTYVARVPYTDISQAEAKLAECTAGFQEHQAIWWVLSPHDSAERIGYCGFFGIDGEAGKAEIGYGLLQDHWGQGYASEAVGRIVQFGFEQLKLHRIFGLVVPGNTASENILKNLGFSEEGVLEDNEYARGQYFDMAVFARINPTGD